MTDHQHSFGELNGDCSICGKNELEAYREEGKMKLNFEQRQRAQELVPKIQDDVDWAAEELCGLRDKLKQLVEAAKVFNFKFSTEGEDPDLLVVGHIRGTLIHSGELRRLHEALTEAEEE